MEILTQLSPAGPGEITILTQLSPAGHVKTIPDTAPEPGQHHTKSREILSQFPLQVHFSTSTVLRKNMTPPWAKKYVMAPSLIPRNKKYDTAQPS